MTLPEQMIGHAVVALGILALQTMFMMIVLFVIFDNVIEGSIALALSLLFLVGLSGMCYGENIMCNPLLYICDSLNRTNMLVLFQDI